MVTSMMRFPLVARAALAGASLFLGLVSALPMAGRAVEPDPDYKTLIFPSIIPKAGSLAPAPNSDPGSIRNAYETYYENYWTDTSYHSYDPATGAKIRGFYIDTKTYGYIHMPWPITQINAGTTSVAGAGEGFADGQRLYSEEITVVADGADADGVWTPGESFRDDNGNGQYDETRPAEDFWNNDNTQVLLQRRDAGGAALGTLAFPRGSYRGPVDNTAVWNATAGELFADYNDNTDLTNDTLGYDAAVAIYVAAGGAQTLVNINELDLSPTDAASINEGDFAHTLVADPAMLVGVPPPNIPRNGVLDYTSTNADEPQVRAATYRNGNALIVQYPSYVVTNATTEAAGYVYRYADTHQVVGPPPANSAIRTITVTVYQTGELYGVAKAPAAFPPANEYGDTPAGAGNVNLWPNTRDVLSDNTWTPIRPAEPFEDYLVFGGATGAYRQDLDPAPPVRPGRNGVITQADYEAYITWNYNGDAAALIARAGNGRYDGPEAWTESQQTKVTLAPLPGLSTPEPLPSPIGNWGGGPFGFATWQDWWQAAFLSPAPAWGGLVANVNAYAPDSGPSDAGWIPAQSWSYDSDREFCDLPSSMYHLGGDPAAVTAANYDPLQGFLRTDLAAAGLPMGDSNLGEITSPWSNNVYGQDIGPAPAPGNPDWVGPGAADNIIIAAGPFCFNIHGNNGHDAGNVLALERMTWRTTGDRLADPDYPANLRDTNLDGFLDTGAVRGGDVFYANGGDGAGDYPYNRMRYMEDLIELWDGAQDFNAFVRPSDGVTDVPLYGYGIYEETENPGSGGLGGPAGATTTFLTRDRVDPYDITFQIRPIEGGNLDDAVAGGEGITVSNVVNGANFAMGILCHEQGHDLLGWPDLYDYDVWNGQGATINTPIGAYDLMSGGGLVHGIPDFKTGLDGPPDPVNGLPWITPVDLESIVPLNGGPTVVELWPGEDYHQNSFFRYRNPDAPEEYLYFYYYGSNSPYAPSAGGPGMYVTHTDNDSNPLGVPNQQRQNGHYTWEIIQADGLYQLQDGTNSGDGGDPFPGTANKRIFTEDTIPALRWWDQQEAGLRVLDIQLPTAPGQPALVTFERYQNPTSNVPYYGNDLDADGIPDTWEVHYWGVTGTANATSDSDNDGLSDFYEFLAHTDPTKADSDLNGTPDRDEDTDNDGLLNAQEQTLGSHPRLADTDDDGIQDGLEAAQFTSPISSVSPLVERVLNVTGAPGVYAQIPARLVPWFYDHTLSPTNWTVEAWIKPAALGVAGDIMAHQVSAGKFQYRLALQADGKIAIGFSPDNGAADVILTTPQPVVAGTWAHVSASWTRPQGAVPGRLTLRVDGVVVAQLDSSRLPLRTPGAGEFVRIGQGFNGQIDDVRFWNAIPSTRTLSQLKSPLMGTETGLVAYFRFDDGTYPGSTSASTDLWTSGQIEDFTKPTDWLSISTRAGWPHAATLVGGATLVQSLDAPIDIDGVDTDGDGIPDGWETANGLNPDVDDAGLDPDNDGLSNIDEYLAGTNPNLIDSNGNGVSDANEDSDADGLSNAVEVSVTMTNPGVADTDDDGIADGDEVSGLLAGAHNRVSSPLNAFDPPRRKSMRFNGDGHLVFNHQDRHNLKTWTIQAWVKPDAGADGVIISRRAGFPGDPVNPGLISYELGVKNIGGAIRPYVKYVGLDTTTFGAREVLVDGTGATEIKGGSQATSQIAPLEWSHVAGTYDPDTHTLSLYINGDLSSYRTDAYEPVWLGLNTALPPTPLTVGGGESLLGVVQNGFEGWLDDVAILSGAMSASDIKEYSDSDVSELDLLRAGSGFSLEEQARPVYSVDQMLAFPHRDRELMIRFKPNVNRTTYAAIATGWGTAKKRSFTQLPMLAVSITDGSSMADKIAQIKADPRVEYVQPNFTREFHKTPNDARYGEMWGLNNVGQDGGIADADIDAPEAWVKSIGNDSVTIAVIDSGCDTSHPDIAPNLWVNPGEIAGNGIDDDGNGYVDDVNGYDFGDDDPNVEDPVGHGTHTAGTIGAVGNNTLGVVGVNWKTRLMILKIGAADGSLPTDAIIAAIEYAWRNGAKVSNNSYGGYFFDQAEFDAWSAANQAGHLAVCSAGNDANDNDGFLPAYPCSFTLPNILSVAATDRNDDIADFSNFGVTSVDLGAPGVDILSTLPGGYGVYSGTSMAGPHVAGVATLLMASSPGLSIDAVKQTILSTVDRVASLNGLVATGGRLNASRAVGGAGTPVLFLTFDDGGVTAEDSTYARDWAFTQPWFHAGTLVNAAFDAAEFLNSQRDTDQDGLPDWWELAVGLDPNSADGNNGGDGDLDGDGLSNKSEYLSDTNPRVVDTDRDGVSDFNEDLDGDGLSNAQEQTHGTHPLLSDTDDDGVNDSAEIAQSTSPIDAMDPSVDRCMQFSGNGRLKIRSEIGTDVMGSGTIELWVKSDADAQNAVLVRRAEMFAFNNQRWIDYEVGLQNGIPYGLFQFRINNTQLITQRVDACRPIGREWTHIAVVRDIENDQLRILVDGAYEGQTHTVQRPPLTTYGVFETTFGGGDRIGGAVQNGFRGCLDAIRVWSYARAGYALNTQRGDRFPEFTDTGFGLSAPLRVFNFDDGGTTAENSRYVQDWLHNWQHAADLQGDAAFQLSPWHPLNYDLDDDTVADNNERLGNTSIYQSEWPYVMRALQFPGGTDLRVDERMDGVETAFYALREWTLECWVRPEAVPAGTATLIRRFTKAGNYSTFELGLENVAGGAVPYLKFHRSDAGKTVFTMRAGYPIPVGTGSEEWTHLAATYDDDNNLVMLQVNGTVVNMSTDTAAAPYTAPAGILQLGSPEFIGSLRDVRIWSTPRTAQQVRDQREENLLFKSAEIQYSFNGDSATFLGRASSTNTVDNESAYYLDYTQAVVDGYGYNLLLGHYTQPYTLQTWVNIPAGAATDNNILIERKLPVGVTDTGQNIYATCHSIRLDGNGRPFGYWEGTLFTYVYTTVGGNPPAVALNIDVEAVDNAVGSEIDLRDGQWHHVALVGDGVNVTLYVDGRPEATRPYRIIDPARQRYQSTTSFGAVLRYGETFASGLLDEGVIWNAPLSSSQINQTMSLGLTSTDISLGVRSIPESQIPTNALVTAGVTYRNLASYLSLDGEYSPPFVPDDAAPSRPYRMLPLVVGDEMLANSRPPVQIDRLRGLDDSLRGFFPGSDGGKTVENYMRRLDPAHAAFGCTLEPFRVMSEQEIACRMYDSDEDGLPDYWETLYGMDPSDATGQNGPSGDNDLDGLNNLHEYLAGTDPWDADTDRDGIRDAATDSDMDGLSNDAEQNTFGTHPGLRDTDDDGFPDGGEISVARDAANSLDPSLNRVLSLDGMSSSYAHYRDDERFNLTTWTIEAWVNPTSFGTGSDIFARSLGGNIYNYRLRVLADGKLSLTFTPASGGAPVVLTTASSIPLNAWSHVSAYFRPGTPTHTLSISVNGVEVGNLQTPYQPAVEGSGLNTLRIGQTFHGLIEDARIWGTAPLYSQLTVPPAPPQPRTLDELRLPLAGTETNLVAYLRFDDSTYPMFTSGKTGWTHGQIEDFVFPNDWLDRWCNAATLNGNAKTLWTGGIPTIPVPKDCVDVASIDPLFAPITKGSNNLFGNGTVKNVNADTNAYWFCQSTVRRTGLSSMMVGGVKGRPHDHVINATNTFLGITNYDQKNLRLKDNQSSWIETTVMGPGVVSFYWKVASEDPVYVGNEADLLTFRVNGAVRSTTSGEYDWTLVSVPVPAGLQTLRWQYTKDRFGTKFSDAAWLDDVSYLHTGPDTDGDGLPDAYEVSPAYGTNPNVADSDGDGMSDGEEVLFGLNPKIANQFVINDFQLIDGKLYVRWVGMAGVKYQVQVSYDGMMTWTNAPSAMALNQQSMVQATATGDLLYCDPTVLAPGVSAVYRVTIVP